MRQSLLLITTILVINVGITKAQNLSQALTGPAKETASEKIIDNGEAPIISVEVIGLKGNFFKYTPPPAAPKSLLEKAEAIRKDAEFQRQRFRETGQAIVMEHNRLYYRRDTFSYTKGIILHEFMNGRMDFGLFKSYFSPANTAITGTLFSNYAQPQGNSSVLLRNGGSVFFSLRVKLNK